MIILLPVSRFRVVYTLAEGYPFSTLDRLVLRAISEGVTTRRRLVETFFVHPRLLIESLVGLTHAGWVALGGSSEQEFVVTPEGRRAVERETEHDLRFLMRRTTSLYLERVTGAVVAQGEVRYVTKKNLMDQQIWDRCVQLQAEVWQNRLDEGQVVPLLRRGDGQRLYAVGPIDLVTKGSQFIPVSVGIDDESVVNIPDRYYGQWAPIVLEAAREAAVRRRGVKELSWEEFSSDVEVGFSDKGKTTTFRKWSLSWSQEMLLVGSDEHNALLFRALRECRSSIVIASKGANLKGVTAISGAVKDALQRGIGVDILLGTEVETAAIDHLKKMQYDAIQKVNAGKLRFNREAAPVGASVVIFDDRSDAYVGIVGAHDWLTDDDCRRESGDGWTLDISCMVTQPGAVSYLCWSVAGSWRASASESLSSAPAKWRVIGEELEARASDGFEDESEGASCISFVLGGEHLRLFRDAVATAQSRLLIASQRLGSVARRRLSPALDRERPSEF